jgi:D-glycero-beta-D-manno-heptose 1-phosphate adenylyltransferase
MEKTKPMNTQNLIEKKIITSEQLPSLLALWRFQNKKLVFTNGCFDILHLGHIDYLAKAAQLGDVLMVGLNTDDSVRRLKGKNRPVQNEEARARLLASLFFVNAVVLFAEDTPYELIRKVQPDVLVKGKDYRAEEVVGYDIVKARGGTIETIELVEGYSTTAIIAKLSTET